jgi:hypothetical protein
LLKLHKRFPNLGRFEIDFELNAAFEIWKPIHYSEVGNVDDDGEYDRHLLPSGLGVLCVCPSTSTPEPR